MPEKRAENCSKTDGSIHTEMKKFGEAISSGKLKNDVLKNVLKKQKLIKIEKKPDEIKRTGSVKMAG